MKKDITYEQRVFTNRIVDVDSMSVGNLTSKNIKELKQKDKIDGRFFHTSDTDEWFFCWNGELQKLNLKGATLKDVKELIGKTEVLIENANKTANDAKNTAKSALENVGDKADKSVVDALSTKVDAIKLDEYATTSQVDERVAALVDGAPETLDTLNELSAALKDNADIVDLLTNSIGTKQDKIDDLETIRSGAAAGATALDEAKSYVDGMGYATTAQVDIKQDAIEDLQIIREGAAAGATALDEAKSYVDDKVDGKFDAVGSATTAEQNAKDYADSLASNYDAYGSAAQALADAKADASSLYQVKGEYEVAGSAAQALADAKAYVDGMGYATTVQVDEKQDVITDLETIRSGAAAGATALQSVPSEYVTETELEGKGYATIAKVDEKTDELSGKINSIVEITEFEIKDLFAVWKEINIEIKNEDFKDDFEFSDENGISVKFSGGDISEINGENAYKIRSASTVKITNNNKENVILKSIMFSACVNSSSPNHGVCVYAVSGGNRVEISGTNGAGLDLPSKENYFKDIEIPIDLNKDEYDYIEISRQSSANKETLIKNLVICANQKVKVN